MAFYIFRWKCIIFPSDSRLPFLNANQCLPSHVILGVAFLEMKNAELRSEEFLLKLSCQALADACYNAD